MDVSIVLTNFNFNKIFNFQICAPTFFIFKFYGKLHELNKNKFRYCLQGLHFRTFKWHTSYKKYSVTE